MKKIMVCMLLHEAHEDLAADSPTADIVDAVISAAETPEVSELQLVWMKTLPEGE